MVKETLLFPELVRATAPVKALEVLPKVIALAPAPKVEVPVMMSPLPVWVIAPFEVTERLPPILEVPRIVAMLLVRAAS